MKEVDRLNSVFFAEFYCTFFSFFFYRFVFFFFAFTRFKNVRDKIYCLWYKCHCLPTVPVLFMYCSWNPQLLYTKKNRDNYSKPTWGLARLRFAYPWFKTYHFAHLRYLPLGICCPPLHLPLEKHILREKQT